MREITVSELGKILKEHKKWCDTGRVEGEKAKCFENYSMAQDVSVVISIMPRVFDCLLHAILVSITISSKS